MIGNVTNSTYETQSASFNGKELISHKIKVAASQVAAFALGIFKQIGAIFSSVWHNLQDKVRIITIAKIPSQERETVIRYARELITPGMDEYDIVMIIEAIEKIPAEEREEVIGYATRELVTPDTKWYERIGIIKAIVKVPTEEREALIRYARELITPQISCKHRILNAITRVPAHERDDVITHALQLINGQMHAHDIVMQVQNVAAVPAAQRAAFVQNGGRVVRQAAGAPQLIPHQGVNVHAGIRDQKTKEAIELMLQGQTDLAQITIEAAKEAFVAYLNQLPESNKKTLARDALSGPKKRDEPFGPLIDKEGFSILGLQLYGAELIGRLWLFASNLRESEQSNAKESMVSALANSYEHGDRVCNQGKTQRLAIGVLQGRLEGVQIDNDQITIDQVVNEFFLIEANQQIDNLTDLFQAIKIFLNERPMVNKNDFIKKIKEFAILQGMVQEDQADAEIARLLEENEER